MKLVNMITWKGYPMRRVGLYAALSGELEFVKGVQKSIEWTVQVVEGEAVLLGEAMAGVLEASDKDREVLSEATLSVRVDGEPVVNQIPLLGSGKPQPPAFRSFMFLGIEDDEPRGIFLSNGTIVEAVVRAPHRIKVRKASKVKVMVGAELYRTA